MLHKMTITWNYNVIVEFYVDEISCNSLTLFSLFFFYDSSTLAWTVARASWPLRFVSGVGMKGSESFLAMLLKCHSLLNIASKKFFFLHAVLHILKLQFKLWFDVLCSSKLNHSIIPLVVCLGLLKGNTVVRLIIYFFCCLLTGFLPGLFYI